MDEDSCKKSKADKTDASARREKEIYHFDHNSFREFGNEETVISISLHPTRRLVALYSPSFPDNSLLEIYTLDGLFVTSKSLCSQFTYHWSSGTNIHFTEDIIVLSGSNSQTTRYNDYNVKQNNSIISLGFDCDKDGFIYAPISKTNEIAIYSHDLEYLKPFDAYNSEYGEGLSLCIRKDTMVILSAHFIRNNRQRRIKIFTIQRYDLSKKMILQTIKFNRSFMFDPKYLCLDLLDNVIISNNSRDKLAVWYSGGRVRYYHPNIESFPFRIAMTEDFQMFRCTLGHKLIVYEPK